jgi:hypothetical protein
VIVIRDRETRTSRTSLVAYLLLPAPLSDVLSSTSKKNSHCAPISLLSLVFRLGGMQEGASGVGRWERGEKVPFPLRDLPFLVKENPEALHSSNSLPWKPQKSTWKNTSPSFTTENKKSKSHIVWVAAKKKMDGLVIRFLIFCPMGVKFLCLCEINLGVLFFSVRWSIFLDGRFVIDVDSQEAVWPTPRKEEEEVVRWNKGMLTKVRCCAFVTTEIVDAKSLEV